MNRAIAIVLIISVWLNFAISLGVRLNRPGTDGWFGLFMIVCAIISALAISALVWRGATA